MSPPFIIYLRQNVCRNIFGANLDIPIRLFNLFKRLRKASDVKGSPYALLNTYSVSPKYSRDSSYSSRISFAISFDNGTSLLRLFLATLEGLDNVNVRKSTLSIGIPHASPGRNPVSNITRISILSRHSAN